MYRNLLGILAVFAVALLLVGVTFSASQERKADFVFINGTEPKSLDPAIMTGQPEGRIADAIFEGLTYHDPASMLPAPGMAESWDISKDGLTYTFHMRPGVTWSDGTPVTARDFAWSWRRMQRPATASEYAYLLHMVKGAEAFNTYAGNVVALVGDDGDAESREASAVALLEQLIGEHPDGVEPDGWRAFIDKAHLTESIKGTPDAELRRALGAQTERVPVERLRVWKEALIAEAARRRALAEEADRTFGRTAGVFARDDETLVVELRAITPYFLDLTAFYPTFPVPRHVIEGAPGERDHEDDWYLPGRIVSNGPFRLVDWRVNQRIRLEKSDSYWNRDAIKLDLIDALPIENAATCLNLYLEGGVHWLPSNYPNDLLDILKRRPDFRSNPGLVVYFYRFNCTKPYLKDPRVRQAICMAVDRQPIVEHIGKLGQPVATTFVPPGIPGYEPPESGIRYDPERAKELLAAAVADGAKIPALGILYNTQEGHMRIAENVADQLRRNLGLDVTAFNQEWQAYQSATRNLQYDMVRSGWIGDYVDPNTFLDMWVTNGGNNQTGWSNAFYDQLIELAADIGKFIENPAPVLAKMKEPERCRALLAAVEGATTGDARFKAVAAVRMHVFREAEAILVQDGFPVMPIYFYVVSSLVRPEVDGFYETLTLPDGTRMPNLQDIHPLRGMSIRSGAR